MSSEGDTQAQTAAASEAAPAPRRRWIPIILVVLASIIGLLSIFALWAKRQLLETDTWVNTSGELLQNEDIRDQVANALVAGLYANVDVEAQIAKALPPELEGLAGPASGGVKQLATEAAKELLATAQVQALWEEANRGAQQTFVKIVEDEGQFVSTGSGTVTLNLGVIVGKLAADVGIGGDVASKLPPQAAQIEILKSNELEAAQTAVSVLKTLAWFLTALTLVLFALAIYLERDRRREMLRTVGYAFVVVGALVLILHSLAGNAVVGALASTSAEPAADAAWSIGTQLLTETGQSIVAYGVIIVLAAWLAGPTSSATWVRRGLAPFLRRPQIAYGTLAVLLLLLFVWDPLVATSRFVPSLILIALLALGVEFLRRQTMREFPDRTELPSPADALKGMSERRRQRREAGGPPPAASPEEARIAQLERLGQLRASGVISDEELAEQKRRILS